jgi:plasmid stabilization system protein ParE
MEVRWSPEAAVDLTRIVEYIRKDNLEAAQRVAKAIYERAGALGVSSYRGRTGRVEDTRRPLNLPLQRRAIQGGRR